MGAQLSLVPRFDGATYVAELDEARLGALMLEVWHVMRDGRWRTLEEIHRAIGQRGSEASISARLRDLRKERYGGLEVQRRRRGREERGLFEYRVAGKGPR